MPSPVTLPVELEVKLAGIQHDDTMPCSSVATDILPATAHAAPVDDDGNVQSDEPAPRGCVVDLERSGVPVTAVSVLNLVTTEQVADDGSSEELGDPAVPDTDAAMANDDAKLTSSQAVAISSTVNIQDAVDAGTATPKREDVDGSEKSVGQDVSSAEQGGDAAR